MATPEQIADQLYGELSRHGFLGIGGCDDDKVLELLRSATDMMCRVKMAYMDRHPGEQTLEDALYDKLKNKKLCEALHLYYEVALKTPATSDFIDDPEWVSRLYKAFNTGFLGGTDEDEVMRVLREANDADQMDALVRQYAARYPGEPGLEDELYDELSGDELRDALMLFYRYNEELPVLGGDEVAIDGTISPVEAMKWFKPLFSEFEKARFNSDTAEMTRIAGELTTAPYEWDDYLLHGIEVVCWLYRQNEKKMAADFLKEVDGCWYVEAMMREPRLPHLSDLSWAPSGSPCNLVELGGEAARNGEHETAFFFLGVANRICTYYIVIASAKRIDEFETLYEESKPYQEKYEEVSREILASADRDGVDWMTLRVRQGETADEWKNFYLQRQLPLMIAKQLQYQFLQQQYDWLRSIYNVYHALELEALTGGDEAIAASCAEKSRELHNAIKKEYSYGVEKKYTDAGGGLVYPVEIAELALGNVPPGVLLTLYGANGVDIQLSQLPGLPPPSEIGFNTQSQSLNALQPTLMAQTDFVAEVNKVPEARALLAGQVPDLSDNAMRQEVLKTMYRVYHRKHGNSALRILLELVQRYLISFTYHTEYNVPDHGTSYFDAGFATELAGRQERDCGVYAMLTAWDIFNVVKSEEPERNVVFDIWTTIDHIMLAIIDRTGGQAYVVNNHVINSVPNAESTTILKAIGDNYGDVRSRDYSISPSWRFTIGSTADSVGKFHDEAWDRWDTGVRWSMRIPDAWWPPQFQNRVVTPADSDYNEYLQLQIVLADRRRQTFYNDMVTFDKESAAVADALGRGVRADDPEIVGKTKTLTDLIAMFKPGDEWYGAEDETVRRFLEENATSHYLLGYPSGQPAHPIVRVAKALRDLGRPLSSAEQEIVDFVEQEKL